MKPHLLRVTTVPLSLAVLLRDQARYMEKHGFQVSLASADGVRVAEIKRREGCPHYTLPLVRRISVIRDLRALLKMIYLLIKLRPNIIHTHTPKAGLIGMLAGWVLRVPHRVHTVGGLPYMTMHGWRRKLLVFAEKLTYRSAHHVWPNSYSLLDFIRTEALCDEDKLSVVGNGSSNGVDLEAFSAARLTDERLEAAKALIDYDPKQVYLLTVGRIVKDKGITELISAFQQIRKKNDRLRLILLGPLEYEREEEKLPSEILAYIRQAPEIIHIHWANDVAAMLHLANLLVHPSYREGLPNVLLQAGAMQCPVICSDIPGNIDVIMNNKTGRLFTVGDTAALVACLESALARPDTTQQMANTLRTVVETKFDRKIIQAALLQQYREILK